MISLIESSFFRPPKSTSPTEDDLSQYGLTRQQFDEWKMANPDSRYRKFEQTWYDPRFQAAMSAYWMMNGRYVSAANAFNRSFPHEVEKRNQRYLHSDLTAAKNYYDQNPAVKNQ